MSENKSAWVSVKERLPKEGMALIYAASSDPQSPLIMTAWWNEERQRWDLINEYWGKAVTHWMELPDPPEAA